MYLYEIIKFEISRVYNQHGDQRWYCFQFLMFFSQHARHRMDGGVDRSVTCHPSSSAHYPGIFYLCFCPPPLLKSFNLVASIFFKAAGTEASPLHS